VEALDELLTWELGVRHLEAVIGSPWERSRPSNGLSPILNTWTASFATAKTKGNGIVRLESEITALTTDGAFQGGDYKEEPVEGIQAFALVWTAWLFLQEWWREELWKSEEPAGTTLPR
jgi:homoserine O-acetyltransferase